MIIKKIAKLAKLAHSLGAVTADIYDETHQWIGGAWGAYDISDLPEITYEQACVMFDYNAKTIDKIHHNNDDIRHLVNSAKEASHYIRYENDQLEIHTTYIGDECVKLIVDKTQSVFAFVTAIQLSPVGETDYTSMALIKGEKGDTYLLVYEGLNLIAILPTNYISRNMVESWQESHSTIYSCMSIYLQRLLDAEKEVNDFKSQYTLDDSGEEDKADAE